MARILHIIHELSLGGAARSMIATAKYSARRSGHLHSVLPLVRPVADPAAANLAREGGLRLVVAGSPEDIRAEMAAADIVQIHWWNVPEMQELLSGPLPPMRLMLFYHVAGDGAPHIITPALRDFADLNVPCNPYSFGDLPVFAGMDPAARSRKVALVYDAADFERLQGLERRPHQGFNVGYIGTVDFVKMHPRYVSMSTAVRVPEARFVVCGGGGSLEQLKAQAAAAGQSHRFDFKGYVADIRPVLAEMDAYGYPLCEDTYAAGELNLQEVMFAGIPPVVFPYGGVKSLVAHGKTGLVVQSDKEYAEALEHLHADVAERRRLGMNAAAHAREVFGAENASVDLDRAYDRMLAEGKRSREWPGASPVRSAGTAFVETLGDHGAAFRASREAPSLAAAIRADEEIAASSRLAFQSGILAYRGRYPGDPWLRYWAGLGFARADRHEEAAIEFAEAVKAGFPHWRALWRLAEAAGRLGRPDLAAQARTLLETRAPGWRGELVEAGAAEAERPARGAASTAPAREAGADIGVGSLRQAGVNLIGYASSNLGLGAAARNTLGMLQERGIPVTVFDLDAGGGRSLHETYFRELCVPTVDLLPHGINLWHMNPPEVAHFMHRSLPKPEWDRFNVCVPFWELPVLPDTWIATLEAMDLVLAPTRFIEGNLAAVLGSARVRHFRQPLRMPEVPRLGRETWGIPPGDFVFATSFDCGSDTLRKNPSGTVAAFRKRFGGQAGVTLIVKWVNEGLDDSTRRAAAELRREIDGAPNIRILDRTMPYPEVLAMYRAADAFVSLHRAEGLGLGLLECMSLGKPVIGTAWSGNMDFMTESNSCLVGHRLVPVPAGSTYDRMLGGKPARWAEPDLEEAGEWMARLAADPALRQGIGARAAEDIRAYNREAHRGDAFDGLEVLWRHDRAAGNRARKVFDVPVPASPSVVQTPPVRSEPPPGSPSGTIGPVRTPPSQSPPSAGPSAPTGSPAKGPLDGYMEPRPQGLRPAISPDGQHPLQLHRLASLGLLTPPPGSANGTSKVTAIVSTYNSETFIRGCLRNLVEQTLFAKGRLEIVVVDSGSPQGEGAVVAEYRERHPGIVYIRTERETLYAAWNRAVKASTGKYLVNSNTDDRHRPDAFERMAAALDASYAGLVYGDAILTGGENETWASNTATHSWFLPDFNVRQALTDCPFGCVVMWRRSLHDEIGYFDPAFKIAGDYEFFLKASILRGAIHLKEPLALYYESQKNLSYGNQPLVDKEVDSFLRPLRLSTPMETIYPFLRVEHTKIARLAAAMDYSAVLLHPLARRGPVEALTRLLEVLKEVGMVPELVNNLALILLVLGQKAEAQNLMRKTLAENPGISGTLGLGTPEGDWIPTRMLRVHHDGLLAIPEPVFSAHTRPPLPGRENAAWTAGRRAGG